MKTNHPENFEIEIDRGELRRLFARAYRRFFWAIGGTIGMFVCLFSMAIIPAVMEGKELWLPNGLAVLLLLALVLLLCVLMTWLLAESAWLIHGKKAIAKRVKVFRVEVEGPFLRIIDVKSDRKIHFRQIGDYEAVLGNKRNPKVGMIRMSGPSGTNSSAYLNLWAVKDALAMRDLLAEVDAERE